MKKQIKDDVINQDYKEQPTWKDIKGIEFQDNDLIQIVFNEEDYRWMVRVERFREETDKECDERVKMEKFLKEHLKKRRYEQFLKLKKEFEK